MYCECYGFGAVLQLCILASRQGRRHEQREGPCAQRIARRPVGDHSVMSCVQIVQVSRSDVYMRETDAAREAYTSKGSSSSFHGSRARARPMRSEAEPAGHLQGAPCMRPFRISQRAV